VLDEDKLPFENVPSGQIWHDVSTSSLKYVPLLQHNTVPLGKQCLTAPAAQAPTHAKKGVGVVPEAYRVVTSESDMA
jgi:hypothetical protein